MKANKPISQRELKKAITTMALVTRAKKKKKIVIIMNRMTVMRNSLIRVATRYVGLSHKVQLRSELTRCLCS